MDVREFRLGWCVKLGIFPLGKFDHDLCFHCLSALPTIEALWFFEWPKLSSVCILEASCHAEIPTVHLSTQQSTVFCYSQGQIASEASDWWRIHGFRLALMRPLDIWMTLCPLIMIATPIQNSIFLQCCLHNIQDMYLKGKPKMDTIIKFQANSLHLPYRAIMNADCFLLWVLIFTKAQSVYLLCSFVSSRIQVENAATSAESTQRFVQRNVSFLPILWKSKLVLQTSTSFLLCSK